MLFVIVGMEMKVVFLTVITFVRYPRHVMLKIYFRNALSKHYRGTSVSKGVQLVIVWLNL